MRTNTSTSERSPPVSHNKSFIPQRHNICIPGADKWAEPVESKKSSEVANVGSGGADGGGGGGGESGGGESRESGVGESGGGKHGGVADSIGDDIGSSGGEDGAYAGGAINDGGAGRGGEAEDGVAVGQGEAVTEVSTELKEGNDVVTKVPLLPGSASLTRAEGEGETEGAMVKAEGGGEDETKGAATRAADEGETKEEGSEDIAGGAEPLIWLGDKVEISKTELNGLIGDVAKIHEGRSHQ